MYWGNCAHVLKPPRGERERREMASATLETPPPYPPTLPSSPCQRPPRETTARKRSEAIPIGRRPRAGSLNLPIGRRRRGSASAGTGAAADAACSLSPPSSPPARGPLAVTWRQSHKSGSLDRLTLEAISRKSQQYDLREEMVSGNFGKVHRAKDTKEERDVVVKQVSIFANNIWYVEVILGDELTHRGVSRMLDMFIMDKQVFMVYEYAPSMDLIDWTDSFHEKDARSEIPVMTEEITRHIAWQLVSALHYCHGKGVAHRDIKLDNIRINQETLEVVLIDFGLSFVTEKASDKMQRDTRCGSAYYVPPEILQVCDDDPIDPFATDVWGLGVVLFCVSHGHWPYFTDTETLEMSHWEPVSSEFSYEMGSFLQSALWTDPHERARIEQLVDNPWLRISNEIADQDRQQWLHDVLQQEWDIAVGAMTRRFDKHCPVQTDSQEEEESDED